MGSLTRSMRTFVGEGVREDTPIIDWLCWVDIRSPFEFWNEVATPVAFKNWLKIRKTYQSQTNGLIGCKMVEL